MSIFDTPVEEALREQHPDWTDQQVHAELARLEAAKGDGAEPSPPPSGETPPDPMLDGDVEPSPVDQEADAPALPKSRLRRPEQTNGVYLVLWARKPRRGEERPRYQEVAYVQAREPDHAKALAIGYKGDPVDEKIAAFLKHSAAQKPGILLRAVPAMHWPDTVEATTFVTPDPVLTIG